MSDVLKITNYRLPQESTEAYEAYRTYRDLSPGDRSQKLVSIKLDKNRSQISRWSAKFSWIDRVAEWDDKKNTQIDIIQENVEMAAARRHVDQAQRLQTIAMDELERLALFSADQDIPMIRPAEAIKMVDTGFKMERLALGQSTENQDHLLRAKPLTPEEVKNFDQIIDSKIYNEEDDLDVDLSGS